MELARNVGGIIAAVSGLTALISFILCFTEKPPIRTFMVSVSVMIVSLIGTIVVAQVILSRS